MEKTELDLVLNFFEFCPACHGQLKIGHREGCEIVAAVFAQRPRLLPLPEFMVQLVPNQKKVEETHEIHFEPRRV